MGTKKSEIVSNDYDDNEDQRAAVMVDEDGIPLTAYEADHGPPPWAAVTSEELAALVAVCQARVDAYMAKHFPTLGRCVIAAQVGRRYARLTKAGGGLTPSTYGFVDMTTGDLLKAAGWKGPAKGVRGNLRGNDACASAYGIA